MEPTVIWHSVAVANLPQCGMCCSYCTRNCFGLLVDQDIKKSFFVVVF